MAGLIGLVTTNAYADGNSDAQARITARKLGQEAIKLFDDGYYSAALEKFDAASSILPTPTLSLYSSRCLVKLGRLVEASERYLEATRMKLEKNAPAVMLKAQVTAAQEREKLLPTIPLLKIEVSGPVGDGVRVTLDGEELQPAMLQDKIPVDPGKHVARAERKDTSVKREVSVAPSEVTQILLALPPLPPPPTPETPTLRIVGWASAVTGAAGMLAFIANGAAVLALGSSLTSSSMCSNNLCDPSLQGDVDAYGITRITTTVGLIAGVAGLGAGVPLLLLNPVKRPSKGAHITPFIGAGTVGFSGSF